MRLRIKSPEDFWAGIMFMAFGIVAAYLSGKYAMGSAMRMGPGYFPTVLSWLMLGLGTIIAARSFVVQGEGVGRFAFRGLLVLGTSMALFGWCVDRIGFIPSLMILAVGSALATDECRWKEVIALTAALVTGCWALFIYALELPFRLFWWS